MMQRTREIPPIIRKRYQAVAKSPMYLPKLPLVTVDSIAFFAFVTLGKQYLLRSAQNLKSNILHTYEE